MRFLRERPWLAVGLAVMHYPIALGLWVMATEALAEHREALAQLVPSTPQRLTT